MTAYTVIADRDVCMGSQQCADIAPQVFVNDQDGLVVVINETPGEELRKSLEQAAAICPTQAIRLTER